MVGFLEENIKKHPGKASLKFNVQESKTNAKISLCSLENGFEMNDEMAAFLQECPEFEVQIVSY
jgi:DNA polymerase III subunit alpha